MDFNKYLNLNDYFRDEKLRAVKQLYNASDFNFSMGKPTVKLVPPRWR